MAKHIFADETTQVQKILVFDIPNNRAMIHLDTVFTQVDKDKSCARLAADIGADVFLVLTAVDYVYLNFNKENQKNLERVSNREMTAYCKQGHFAKGSMLPKIEACLEFLNQNPKGVAMITSLEKANQSLKKRDCTVIYNEGVKNKC